MCRQVGDLNPNEQKVESALRGRFMKINEKPGVEPILPHGALRVRDVLVIENGEVVPGPKWGWLQRPV
jgi:hypothetical protein